MHEHMMLSLVKGTKSDARQVDDVQLFLEDMPEFKRQTVSDGPCRQAAGQGEPRSNQAKVFRDLLHSVASLVLRAIRCHMDRVPPSPPCPVATHVETNVLTE